MSEPSLQEQIFDALFTVRSTRQTLQRQGAAETLVSDLEPVEVLLERLATQHSAYFALMRGLEGRPSAGSMAASLVTFLTYLRQDYRKHARPDDETYNEFCQVLAELYDAAKRARRQQFR